MPARASCDCRRRSATISSLSAVARGVLGASASVAGPGRAEAGEQHADQLLDRPDDVVGRAVLLGRAQPLARDPLPGDQRPRRQALRGERGEVERGLRARVLRAAA